MTQLFDLSNDIFNTQGCLVLVLRLAINLFFVGIITIAVYMRKYGRNEYIFTYIMFNAITFTLCFLLRQVPIELGFALGLFAVFGILRYRTEPIRIHDLTYLFIVIGIGIVNAVANDQISLGELLLVNGLITGMVALLENRLQLQNVTQLTILYDDMEKIKGEQQLLIEDIQQRTGKNVFKITLNNIDLLRETANITIFFHPKSEA
jgi:hypothetical protein